MGGLALEAGTAGDAVAAIATDAGSIDECSVQAPVVRQLVGQAALGHHEQVE